MSSSKVTLSKYRGTIFLAATVPAVLYLFGGIDVGPYELATAPLLAAFSDSSSGSLHGLGFLKAIFGIVNHILGAMSWMILPFGIECILRPKATHQESTFNADPVHRRAAPARRSAGSSDSDFLFSAAVADATNSPVVGYVAGKSLAGAVVGSAMSRPKRSESQADSYAYVDSGGCNFNSGDSGDSGGCGSGD